MDDAWGVPRARIVSQAQSHSDPFMGSDLDQVFLWQSIRGRWLRVKMKEVNGAG